MDIEDTRGALEVLETLQRLAATARGRTRDKHHRAAKDLHGSLSAMFSSAPPELFRSAVHRRADSYWRDQPFLFNEAGIADTHLGLLARRAELSTHNEEEIWRTKAQLWTDRQVFSQSGIRQFFDSEISFHSRKSLERTFFFNCGQLEVDTDEWDRTVTSSTCEWLWIVWDSFESIADDVREELWSSSWSRLRRDWICQVKPVTRQAAESDFEELFRRGWDHLPWSLLCDSAA
jgi:hypothetical protein